MSHQVTIQLVFDFDHVFFDFFLKNRSWINSVQFGGISDQIVNIIQYSSFFLDERLVELSFIEIDCRFRGCL